MLKHETTFFRRLYSFSTRYGIGSQSSIETWPRKHWANKLAGFGIKSFSETFRFNCRTPRTSRSVGRPFACQTVRRLWGGEDTPRRIMGPGAFGPWRVQARSLVHPSETWSHPRGTLGRCLKGSETISNDIKKRGPPLISHKWEMPASWAGRQAAFLVSRLSAACLRPGAKPGPSK